MPLQPGERLGPFEIVAFIGAGGMGEVYRARDTRLGRTVAIKILSGEIANDVQLRERFEREAQTISTLNHPSICTLHDVGRERDVDFLVMEFLEGETLADRLARGPLPLKDALTIAAQVGDGLEAAHRHGIVHRDLKPGNIMLVKAEGTARSQAKLLDFGLAKLRGGIADNTPVVVSAARTDVGNLTAVGAVLGTLQYMSPEQLAGRKADAQSDIFALGTVLYEMVTGRKAFEGKSQVSLMAAILEHDPPPISSLQPISPRALDHLVRGCLAKEPAERWQNAADVVKQIRWIADEIAQPRDQPVGRTSLIRERAIWAAGLLVLASAIGVLVLRQRAAPATTTDVVRFEIPPPPGAFFPGANSTPRMAVSPDGKSVVFTVNFRDGKPDQLMIRRFDSTRATPLVTVTDVANESVQQPFWSPDNRFVGFFFDGKLKKVEVSSGVVQTLCSVPGNNFGGAWNADGTIVFGSTGTRGLQRIAAAGGVPSQVTRVDEAKETAHLWPRFLSDGRHVLYQSMSTTEDRAVYVASLDDGTRTKLLTSLLMVDFAPPDHLLFLREGSLLAQRFDVARLTLEGEPIPIAEDVQASPPNGRAGFSVSTNGVLVYRAGTSTTGNDSQLAWFDRSGKELRTVGPAMSIRGLDLSPSGDRAVIHREEGNGSGDLWIVDVERESMSRLTFDPVRHNSSPVWSPDDRIIFAKAGTALSWTIYEKNPDRAGAEGIVYESKTDAVPYSVSPDGKTLVFTERSAGGAANVLMMPLAGGKQTVVTDAPTAQGLAQISPNGRWIAYTSGESGRAEVYIQSFPAGGTKYPVSTTGGSQPRWRGDGSELFFRPQFLGNEIAIMSAAVEPTENGLRVGVPARLFDVTVSTLFHATPFFTYAVTRDGQRFLVSRAKGGASAAYEVPLTVVLNWNAAVDR
jgi:serine/threonine protein kinase